MRYRDITPDVIANGLNATVRMVGLAQSAFGDIDAFDGIAAVTVVPCIPNVTPFEFEKAIVPAVLVIPEIPESPIGVASARAQAGQTQPFCALMCAGT